MKLPKVFVDGFLVEWEAGGYRADVKALQQKSKAIVLQVPRLTAQGFESSAPSRATTQRAQAVRARLARTVRKAPEVMVKITSSCKGMRQIGRHIDYISRKGQIELEDQDGLVALGKDHLSDLKEDWRIGGADVIGNESDRRDTLNIVFSMPAHTDELSMKRAVRAFAAVAFEDHQYVFAYHTPATDPDPNPPAHPHVHVSVKTQGHSGRRLNPRKADLQAWREAFAAQLRAHGIDANATSRLERFQHRRGASRARIALEAEGRRVSHDHRADRAPSRLAGALELEARRSGYYEVLQRVLSASEVPEDRRLAKALAHFLQEAAPPFRKRSQNKGKAPSSRSEPER